MMTSEAVVLSELWPGLRPFGTVSPQLQLTLLLRNSADEPRTRFKNRPRVLPLFLPMIRQIRLIRAAFKGQPWMAGGDQIVIDVVVAVADVAGRTQSRP